MMQKKNVTVKQIQKLDDAAINQYGVPSLALMENAGRSVASEVLVLLKKQEKGPVSIFCGLGNNAGDGFVAARHLINAGIKTHVVLIGKGSRLKSDALTNYRILKRLKYPIKELTRLNSTVISQIKRSHIVVDALFGVGLNRDVTDPIRSVINEINQNARKVISVDIPSGLDGTTGKIYGVCVKADITVTFSFGKKGFKVGQGPKFAGKVVVADIGIPKRLKDRI